MAILRTLVLLFMAVLGPSAAHALQLSVHERYIYATGVLDDGDPIQLRAALAVNGNARGIVFINVGGTDLAAGLAVARIIAQRNWQTFAVGYCMSACAVAFAAGAQRQFASGEHPRRTLLGFTAAYDRTGAAASDVNQQVMRFLRERLGARFDELLFKMPIDRAADAGAMLRFRDVARNTTADRTALFCPSGQAALADCASQTGHDALSIGLLTSAATADLPIPNDLRPKPELFGRAAGSPADAFVDRLKSYGATLCAGATTCVQRWEAALPVYQRQKANRAVAMGVGTAGWGFSDDQETFDLAAKRATYLCNHASNNKKLCRLVAVNDIEVGHVYAAVDADARQAMDRLKSEARPKAGEVNPAVASAMARAEYRVKDLIAATPEAIEGVRTWSTSALVEALGNSAVALIDVQGPGSEAIPTSVHFWEGGLAFADATADSAFDKRFVDMLQIAVPDKAKPVVFFCKDSRCWHAVNAAIRASRAGYSAGWYRDGQDAWSAAKLPTVRKLPAAVLN